MVCKRCGFKIHEEVNYCPSCGYPTREKVVYTAPHAGNTEKVPQKKKKRVWLWVIVVFLGFMILGTVVETEEVETPEPVAEVAETPEPEVETLETKNLAFLDDFTEYGYSVEQIEEMKTILLNVGITEITDLEIGNVSYGMQSVKGLAYKDRSFMADLNAEVQVRFNIESGKIYLVTIYCPSYYHENSTPYLSGLEDRRADLYYDYEGGYLKKIDWENKTVIDY